MTIGRTRITCWMINSAQAVCTLPLLLNIKLGGTSSNHWAEEKLMLKISTSRDVSHSVKNRVSTLNLVYSKYFIICPTRSGHVEPLSSRQTKQDDATKLRRYGDVEITCTLIQDEVHE
jgi:hypothetical protein